MNQSTAPDGIAYVLKGFARTSETFISNEIHLLEQQGLKLTLYSLLRLTGQQHHAVNDAIRARPHYLPATSSLEEDGLWRWLRRNFRVYANAHGRLLRQRPLAYLATLGETLRWAIRYRIPASWQPRTQFIREFCQAGYIAAEILTHGQTCHLHAHFAHTCTTVTMLASRLTGLPFSFTAHAKDIYLRELNLGDLLRVKLNRARFVVTCTAANQQYLAGMHTRTPIHTIYHGLAIRDFRPTDYASLDVPLILSVGRLVPKKGFPDLIEACRLLRERGCPFTCQIIGGGDLSYQQQLQALIEKHQLQEAITLHPPVTQEQLREILPTATVFALPCQIVENGDRDGIPNVLVEAMACGIPVISTEISGIPELIHHNANGLLVSQRDPLALALALERLLSDAALRQTLGTAGRVTIQQSFDIESNVRKLMTLFQAKESAS